MITLEGDSDSNSNCKPPYTNRSSISKETNSVSEISSSTSRVNSTSRENSIAKKSSDATIQLSKSNDILTKFRELWWIQGNLHPKAKWEEASLPYMLKSDVDWEKYSERTDMFNVHGSWEWIDRKVYVYELPLGPHETCSEAIKRLIHLKDPEMMLVALGSVRTKASGKGKEADGSFVPKGKPQVNSDGREGPNSRKPWPNLAIEVASSETERHLLNTVKDYWLYSGRAHDAIAVKLVQSGTIISKIKVWHFCANDRTPMGDLVPVSEFEFKTIDSDDQIILIEPQQYMVNINIECLFHGMPSTFQIPSSIPNPLTIDFYYVLRAMEEELRVS